MKTFILMIIVFASNSLLHANESKCNKQVRLQRADAATLATAELNLNFINAGPIPVIASHKISDSAGMPEGHSDDFDTYDVRVGTPKNFGGISRLIGVTHYYVTVERETCWIY